MKKLLDAEPGTVRNVKKAEAYFRLLPESVPDFSHYDPALYLLKNPEILEGEDESRALTLARFEEAFKRIERFI